MGLWAPRPLSIQNKPGQGKLAMRALHCDKVVVTEGDIGVLHLVDVEWVLATRVRADRDLVAAPACWRKPLTHSCSLLGNRQALNPRCRNSPPCPRGPCRRDFLGAALHLPERRMADYL